MAASSNQNPQQGAFHNYPQKYPNARKKASEVAQHVVNVTRKGPRSMPAVITDTTYHLTWGYVSAQTGLGHVQVTSVPHGTVVPGMRIMVRQIGGQATNRGYVFDGYAPNVSALGSSGSLLASAPGENLSTPFITTGNAGCPADPSLVGLSGYFWYLFCYIPHLSYNPQVPSAATSPITIMQMAEVGTSPLKTLSLDLTPTGLLRFWSSDGHGYITTKAVPPHNIQYIQIQPGLSGAELLVNGQAFYQGLIGSGDEPTFTGGSAVYTLSYMSAIDGSNLAPLGTWVSKMGFGSSYGGGVPIALSTGTSVPDSDSALPVPMSGVTQQSIALYLCTNTPGSSSVPNSATGSGLAGALNVITAYGSLVGTGPY